MNDKIKRVLSAIVAIPILIIFVLTGGTLFKIGIMTITLIALFEYINSYNKTENKAIEYALFIGYFINLIFIFYYKKYDQVAIITLVALLSMSFPIFVKKYNVISSAITTIGYIYIVYFFSLLVLIRDMPNGNTLIWLVFVIGWSCDTAAYYTGRFLGKKKLCPNISPKKTIAGSIGGLLGSIIGVLIWRYFNSNIPLPIINSILLGIIGGAVSQFGDLAASMIKRYSGIKDYGNIMPGHGGILDRFDSILFTVPIVYYYITFFLG